ncbi:MAG: hypothetical protein JO122_21480 [Acetobacteraceae bacterium]|nr:hypothetical protein [Acetobacteraceae bacterium]
MQFLARSTTTRKTHNNTQGEKYAHYPISPSHRIGLSPLHHRSGTRPAAAGHHLSRRAIAMGFYNVQTGDEPYFNNLARQYTLADNYHQAVMGGTGANHIMLGSGDAYWYSDGHGNP